MSGRLLALVGTVVLLAGPLAAVGVSPAGATVYPNVATEAALRTAFDDPTATQIDLSADITLSSVCPNGKVDRTSAAAVAVVVDGHGHTVTQTCTTGSSAVFHANFSDMTFQNITITGGGGTVGSTGGIDASGGGSVSLTNSTVSGNTSIGIAP